MHTQLSISMYINKIKLHGNNLTSISNNSRHATVSTHYIRHFFFLWFTHFIPVSTDFPIAGQVWSRLHKQLYDGFAHKVPRFADTHHRSHLLLWHRSSSIRNSDTMSECQEGRFCLWDPFDYTFKHSSWPLKVDSTDDYGRVFFLQLLQAPLLVLPSLGGSSLFGQVCARLWRRRFCTFPGKQTARF